MMDHEQEGTKINVQDLFQAFQNQPEEDKSAPKQETKKTQEKKERDAALEEAFKDLNLRFIKKLSEEETTSMNQICSQLQLAFWYYLDYYFGDEERGHLYENTGFKSFAMKFINHCEYLKEDAKRIYANIDGWLAYYKKIPAYGAILLDESLDNVLLVQGYSSKTWTFPKGKINQNENPRDCAIREVREETSFDFSTVSNNEKMIRKKFGDQNVSLFLVKNVPTTFQFTPMTKKEIREIQWFNVWDLPGKGDSSNTGTHRFFLVTLFLQEIHNYILNEKIKMETRSQRIAFSGTDLIQSFRREKSTKRYMKKPPIKEEEIKRTIENRLAEMFRSATVQDEHNMPSSNTVFYRKIPKWSSDLPPTV